jgi:putative cardiolipin synthase
MNRIHRIKKQIVFVLNQKPFILFILSILLILSLFRPDPAVRRELIERYPKLEKSAPVFAIHAKTLVIDGRTLFIGTFNLDPRSSNLNTEVGVLFTDPSLAGQVERGIERDMRPENSWNAADNPDRFAPLSKRSRMKFWKTLPLEPLL